MEIFIPYFKKYSLLFFISLIFATRSEGYPFYHYNPKNIKLTQDSFRRYIRPQSRSIVNEYYFLLKTIHPLLGPLVQVKKNIQHMGKMWGRWEKECRASENKECYTILKTIYKTLKDTEQTLLYVKSRYTQHLKNNTDPLLMLLPKINEITLLNYRLIHALEEIQSTLDTSFEHHSVAKTRFEKYIHPMKITSQMMITSLIDQKYRQVFEFAYIQFINSLELEIVEKHNKEYLIKNLENLNLTWNTFHMKITKSEDRPPKNITNLIKIMHNRWNSILKIVLRK